MKILLITTHYPEYKGVSNSVRSYAVHYIARKWVELGHQVRVIRLWPQYPKIFHFLKKARDASSYKNEKFSIDGVDIERVAIRKYPKIDYFEKDIEQSYQDALDQISDDFQADAIVGHMINPSLFLAKRMKEALNIPLLMTLHYSDIMLLERQKSEQDKKRYNEAMKEVDKIGFRSYGIQKEFNQLVEDSFEEKDQYLVFSGIDQEDIVDQKVWEAKSEKKIRKIMVVGRLLPLKNVDILIKAFERVSQKHPELMLEIIGDGPEKEKLMNLAESMEAKDQIIFHGQLAREDVLEKMEESDVFAMVSSPETFGLVYLEAMSKGNIIVGSRGEGIDGVIRDGENGFLSSPGNVEELSEILFKLIAMEKSDKKDLLQATRKTIEKMTEEKMAEDYLEVIQETIERDQEKNGDQ